MVRGHCHPGDDYIYGAKSGGEKVSFQQVANRIFCSNLPLSYKGKLICYNCHSGEPSKTSSSKPFAQKLANYMYSLGYKSCQFFGYLGAMDSFAKPGPMGKAIYSRASGDTSEAPLGTAAMATVQFHPEVKTITTPPSRSRFKPW
ncbi:hypothetical protein [Hahella ganghwensis]|uniref:hypothetical protein n=1 Tax=Hahella ganghwensis TaxID=286420 RepID=UPI0012FCDDF6|nr:hypothetical protein [Hahella ganghwensis]